MTSTNIYKAKKQITFKTFIVPKIGSNLWENAFVVMDNASIHKSLMVEEAIEEIGTKLMYLLILRDFLRLKILGLKLKRFSKNFKREPMKI